MDSSLIPLGPYCYKRKGGVVEMCTYWRTVADKHPQANGFCDYMNLGDGDLHPTVKNGYGEPYEIFLLWDQVKECDVNH